MIGVALPVIAFVLSIVLLWHEAVGWLDLGVMLVLYVLTGLGITVGYHRLLTHRAFQTSRPVQYAFAIFGSMSVQGPVLHWVADHRKHHAHTDEAGDPHSPHLAGYARDWLEDRGMRAIDRLFFFWLALGIAIPFAIGYGVRGSIVGGLECALWAGLVRIFVLHHVTFSINSVCHFFGRRAFATDDESRNVFWLAPLSFGESWHNNHHAFPRSAFHGMRWTQIDPGGMVIRLLERLGLAWNVVRISAERRAEKAVTQPRGV
jgi:stearoyl-CoA desaturase (delta-9 desaturase)